ncbi:MAG: hypothetical protein JXA77_10970 [Bacteroidales bacterium]|nr:hypothetical protein [Bacteroidales bacterium]MBN2819014.1 hypothetical protein [Bacteroidales bacterium]
MGKVPKKIIILFLLFVSWNVYAQPVPAKDENIPFLVTFGGDSKSSWGDDDFCQVFFCLIPETFTKPVYLRIYDPDTGGEFDENKGEFDTKINFSVYGGKDCWSNEDAQSIDPTGNYKSGILIATKSFGNESKYDKSWYTMGPFNPMEGEYVKKFNARIFKIIAEGVSGDDGNLYRYYLSTSPSENKEVEGGNLFTYEYTFRLANNQSQVSQIYPFVDDKTISIQVSNFDWDNDGLIRLISVAKNGVLCDVSNENNWIRREFPIIEEEKNTTVEIQFIKNQKTLIKNNNVAIVVRNQYGETLPFFVIPIGGIPVYSPKIKMESLN